MNTWKTYIVPVRRTVTERYEVRARSTTEAMLKAESGTFDPIDIEDGDAEADYHRIYEKCLDSVRQTCNTTRIPQHQP